MKRFRQYVKEHDDVSMKPVSYSGPVEVLNKIAHTAIKDHLPDVLQFFKSLAVKNQSIKDDMAIYHRDLSNMPHKQIQKSNYPSHDVDEVIPSSADNSSTYEEG